jgi:gamma-glutamylcyclotransferase (GGCT)/AIG2-like uncharacterized protein YtfP
VETNKLFVYGTLLLDDVISVVIGRIPQYQNAVAPGWQIACLPHRDYPGLIPGQGEAVGKVFTDLTGTEWATLDAFEDPAYTLTAIRVLLSTEIDTDALAYIWRGDHIDKPWSATNFSRDKLANYLDRCRNWRQRYEQRSSGATCYQIPIDPRGSASLRTRPTA